MQPGSLTVYAGPMFSGKTEALIHHVLEAESNGLRVRAYKPSLDTRYEDSYIHSHNGSLIKSHTLAPDAPDLPADVHLIAIDEAQFLTPDAVPRILAAVQAGRQVVVSGLDLDCFGKPFGPMPILMAFANEVRKLAGICSRCALPSVRSHRLVRSEAAILVGGSEMYEPRCTSCFDPAGGL